MATTTASSDYRKVDIDAFDEDRYVEEEGIAQTGFAAEIKTKKDEVGSFLRK